MKRWYAGVLFASLFMLLVLRYFMPGQSYSSNAFSANGTDPLKWVVSTAPPAIQNPVNASAIVSAGTVVSSLFAHRNLSVGEQRSLFAWHLLRNLIDYAQALPNGLEAMKEAGNAWDVLMASVEEEKLASTNDSLRKKANVKQCPHFLNKINARGIADEGFKMRIPCGLTQGSSVTIIGIPGGLLGNFRIDLTGEPLPGELEPPIILHYNVRLHGDKITEDPVIVQNTWTLAHDWGEEERCPSPSPENNKKVDELDQCNKMVGKDLHFQNISLRPVHSRLASTGQDSSKAKKYFPFKQGDLSVATLRMGSEGVQMTIDGKHITSFAYRETLESWLVTEVRVSGDLKLTSVVASGLPTSEDSDHIVDLQALQAVPLSAERRPDLFIGVFSTANNFKHRMAVRRTWMQYPAVRSGTVVVRFFVGLHKNQIVNEELWNEARTYGDVQLMPFVDYYNLITLKTLAICIFGTNREENAFASTLTSASVQTKVVSAKYVMKTDDDAFVRVDEVLASLSRINTTNGLLYGLIDSDSRPHRNSDSKWYISRKEWPEDAYPPWAHGPGYVISHDIAEAVQKKYEQGQLKMFKLEDVAMGIWIADMKKKGKEIQYKNEARVYNEGCKDGYVVAHYQGPREMPCLWQKLQEAKRAMCCRDR